jgi:adenylylsulfate kinase
MIYWFTGQPGAGKTTLANALIEKCSDTCINVDGDGLRELFQNFDYSPEGRVKNIQSVIDLARFLDHKGFMRDTLKRTNEVVELYVHTSEIRGREQNFVKEYEQPTENFIDIDTTNKTIDECLDLIPFNRK